MRIASLHRYPVKGLSPEEVESFRLEPGGYVPGDRLFAIENGPSGFDPAAPQHLPKSRFLMLMRNERLARLRTRYNDAAHTLAIADDAGAHLVAVISNATGRAAIEAFFAAFALDDLRGPPRLLSAPDGHRFTDSRRGYVSVINRASVAALEARLDRPVDPLRFRGNILVEGLPAFAEFELVGRTLASPGGVRLEVTDRIQRCAATNVDPQTGFRDLDIPGALMRGWGHMDCGVYCAIRSGGIIRAGDTLRIVDETGERAPF
jgi:hypothetical protein